MKELKIIEQLGPLFNSIEAVIFGIRLVKKKRHDWMRRERVRFNSLQWDKLKQRCCDSPPDKRGLGPSYSRQQVTRLITQYRKTSYIKHYRVWAGFGVQGV